MDTRKAATFIMAAAFALVAGAAEKHWLGTDATSPTLASVAANWDPAGAPTAADDVVLDAGSNNNPMTWDLDNGVTSWTQSDYTGTVTFKTGKTATYSSNTYTAYGVEQSDGSKSFTISGNLTLSSGTWTHEVTPAMTSSAESKDFYKNGTGVYRLLVSVGGSCTIGSSAAIDVTSKGFVKTSIYCGPGYGKQGLTGEIACHGGMGARSDAGGMDRTRCYGSVARPQTIGTARDSAGGGHVTLEVSGALTLDGSILAKSGESTNYSGSGGGIFIHAKTISGIGSVSASSGTITTYGPGGGGRVAIWVDEGDFSNFPVDNVTANAGNGHAISTAGTVFLWAKSDATFGARLIVRGNASVTTTQANYRYSCTPISVANTNDLPALTAIVLSNGANLAIGKDVALDVGMVLASQTGTAKPRFTMFGGSLSVPDGLLIDGFSFLVYDEGASMSVANAGTIGLASGNSLVVDRPFMIDGSLFVTGTVSHTQVTAASTNLLDISVSGDMTVASGGEIDVSNKGWSSKSGPGGATEASVGGVHAGTVPGSSQRTHGDPIHPTDHGSGGGAMSGGGVVKLTVGGTFTLDGWIRAYASNNHAGGNGAGGSVWITAAEVAGSGTIDVKGGSYETTPELPSAGGSGGRIAVRQTVGNKELSAWGVSRTVAGGSSRGGTTSGGGTVYWEKASDGLDHGTLYTSGGNASAGPQLPPADAADAASLAGVKLSASSSGHLYVADDFAVRDFYLPNGGTIHLDGHTLTVTNPAKRKSQSVLGTVDTGDSGEIVWPQRGFMFLFR